MSSPRVKPRCLQFQPVARLASQLNAKHHQAIQFKSHKIDHTTWSYNAVCEGLLGGTIHSLQTLAADAVILSTLASDSGKLMAAPRHTVTRAQHWHWHALDT
jgi:hypothetical protein